MKRRREERVNERREGYGQLEGLLVRHIAK